MEMMNILDDMFNEMDRNLNRNYMHLVPKSTTMKPMYIDDVEYINAEEESTNENIEDDNLIAIGMSIIMFLVVLCGIFYVGWRFLLEKKNNRQNELNQHLMHEIDNFR